MATSTRPPEWESRGKDLFLSSIKYWDSQRDGDRAWVTRNRVDLIFWSTRGVKPKVNWQGWNSPVVYTTLRESFWQIFLDNSAIVNSLACKELLIYLSRSTEDARIAVCDLCLRYSNYGSGCDLWRKILSIIWDENLRYVNSRGQTLLHLAAARGCGRVVSWLLAMGTNPRHCDADEKDMFSVWLDMPPYKQESFQQWLSSEAVETLEGSPQGVDLLFDPEARAHLSVAFRRLIDRNLKRPSFQQMYKGKVIRNRVGSTHSDPSNWWRAALEKEAAILADVHSLTTDLGKAPQLADLSRQKLTLLLLWGDPRAHEAALGRLPGREGIKIFRQGRASSNCKVAWLRNFYRQTDRLTPEDTALLEDLPEDRRKELISVIASKRRADEFVSTALQHLSSFVTYEPTDADYFRYLASVPSSVVRALGPELQRQWTYAKLQYSSEQLDSSTQQWLETLFCSVGRGDIDHVQFLLNGFKIDLNAYGTESGKQTVLHLAAVRRDGPMVSYLLAKGADPLVCDGDGADMFSAWIVGTPEGRQSLCEWLESDPCLGKRPIDLLYPKEAPKQKRRITERLCQEGLVRLPYPKVNAPTARP